MNRFKFRMWTKYPDEEPCWASDYEMDRCMLEKSYTIVDGIYSVMPEEKYQILEQCVGRKDKNDMLIFEGDIVACSIRNREVAWIGDKWAVRNKGIHEFLFNWSDFKIIGNVHENPELLEVYYA